MIIALAGHVDHGKTSLIRALTGVETDRLQQEVERGLTIDLGFAYCDIDGQRIGFVDVPGHHRFVHNMLAGVSPHQCALLVIAADDGVMPQTREHLSIMQLLGLQRGLVVINKVDRVSDTRLRAVRADVSLALADSFLADAPVLPVSATAGSGIAQLRQAIAKLVQPASDADNPGHGAGDTYQQHSRLPIDRAFSYRGVGTIVTGTLHAGTLALDQTVTLFPGQHSTRIRSLRANDQETDLATTGDRVAVNLAGVDAHQIQRGMWLHSGNTNGSQHQILELAVLPDFPRAVRHWSRVHVYHGSSHRLAQLALLDQASVIPGGKALAELICDTPLLSVRGDRLIVRDHGLDQRLGGGCLISNVPAAGRRRDRNRLASIQDERLAHRAADAFSAGIAGGWLSLSEFATRWGLTDAALANISSAHTLVQVDLFVAAESHFKQCVNLARARFDSLADSADGLLPQTFCNSEGIPAAAVGPLQDAIVRTLVTQKQIVLRNGRYHRPDSGPTLSAPEAALLGKIQQQLQIDPPPSLGDIGKSLNIPADKLRKAVAPLAGKGHLVLFGANRIMLPDQFSALANLAVELERDSGPFTVKAFRDASKLGRNLVIDVLEHMDAGGYTRRADNVRTVVGNLDRIIKQ